MTFARSVLLVALIAPRLVLAQSVEAEMLFRDGKKLIKEGKIAEGCEKLEGSLRLESSIGTMLNLADCRERNQQLTTAWITFRKAESAAKLASDGKRATEAARRGAALEGRLSHVTIVVGDRVDGFAITRNGAALDPAIWGTSVPLDRGDYEIVAKAPGFEPWTTKVTVGKEGERIEVRVPKLVKPGAATNVAPARVEPPKQVAAPPPDEEEEEPPAAPAPSTFTTTRKLAIGAAVIGLAGIAGGVVFGMKSQDRQKDADAICPDVACGDLRGVELNKEARTAALTADILFGVGAAGVIGAVALWIIGAPAAAEPQVTIAPSLRPGEATLVVGGRF